MFVLGYTAFFQMPELAEKLGKAMWSMVASGEMELANEGRHTHPLQHLKTMSCERRAEVLQTVTGRILPTMAAQLAKDVDAAAEYKAQQPGAGRFTGMVLADALCFESNLEVMGLPRVDDVEAAIEREHRSTVLFKVRSVLLFQLRRFLRRTARARAISHVSAVVACAEQAWNNDMERETSPWEQFQKVLPQGWSGPVNNKDYKDSKQMCPVRLLALCFGCNIWIPPVCLLCSPFPNDET